MHIVTLVLCMCLCIINSKINGTPKGVYLSISKPYSILTISNLLAHYNKLLCASRFATAKIEV